MYYTQGESALALISENTLIAMSEEECSFGKDKMLEYAKDMMKMNLSKMPDFDAIPMDDCCGIVSM